MLNVVEDIDSLTEFKRHSSDKVEKLKKSRRPLILTINGKAELVVQSAEAYQSIMDEISYFEHLAVEAGVKSMKAGRTRPIREALAELQRKHEIRG